MAIAYPLGMPTVIGFQNLNLRARNTVAVSQSPFTYEQQVHSYDGQMWEVDVSLPPMNRDNAEQWIAFLVALRGRAGTFLLGDPASVAPQGTATSAVVTGALGDSTVTVVMTGSLVAGDYIQLGVGADSTLHKVLLTRTGNGSLEIWPKLRKARSSVTAILTNPKGVFRLIGNTADWNINSANFYGVSFSANEVIS
tara:strand:- start:1008 stop:1595 length:588 start_codon:yes stop_codon:yes gene_type:complete